MICFLGEVLGSSPGGYDISLLQGFRGEGELEVSSGGRFISLVGRVGAGLSLCSGGYKIGLLGVHVISELGG